MSAANNPTLQFPMHPTDKERMNERREQRFVAEQPVVVTVLGDPEIRQAATIRNASGRGLAIEMVDAVAIGAALKIEMEDSFVLGEAVYCKGSPGSHLVAKPR